MHSSQLDVLGIGNAIVDVIASTDEAFLVREGLQKGGMTLIDTARAQELFTKMGPITTISGGSAANTIVGCASFGLKSAFVGRVRNDALGNIFAHDIRAAGAEFETPAAQNGPPTAQCLIVVTPDGERTMSTYLGACQDLHPDDISEAQVGRAKILYLEGYLWDPADAKQAFLKAAQIAHAKGNRVALSLSDSFCVDRYRDEFLDLINRGVIDILFANIHEIKSLYETSDLETACEALSHTSLLSVVTQSEKGASVIDGAHTIHVPAAAIDKLVDTTGAGDLFAAGFLTGLIQGHDHATCAHMGSFAAAEVIQHVGARPAQILYDLWQTAHANGKFMKETAVG